LRTSSRRTYRSGRNTFDAGGIKSFARRFDPQLFHLDGAAERSHFGALCASGWHTAVVWMRLDGRSTAAAWPSAGARGEPVAGMRPGALGLRD